MEQQNTAPVITKKRKLPSFMAAPVRTPQSGQNDAQEQDRVVNSPKTKQNVQPKATKKQRHSQLPLQHTKRSAKSARAQDHLSQQQQQVLNTSDAALVKECKDILSRAAAATGAQQQRSGNEKCKQGVAVSTQPQVALDIMDAETQLLEVLPHATLKYEAAHQPRQAQCSANHTQQQDHSGFALPAEAGPPAQLADMHDSQPQPEPRGELCNSSPEIVTSFTAVSAADSQLTGTTSKENSVKQPSVSASTTVVQQDPLSVAPNKGGSSIDALLQAMLTGELA